MAQQRSRDDSAVRITTASSSKKADIAARQKRYLLSMSLRSICFVSALVTPSPWRWFLIAGAIVLPYIAVVLANVSTTRHDGFALLGAPSDTRQIGPRADTPLPPR